MSTGNKTEHNHRYSIDIPDKIYTALKMKSAIAKKSVQVIILSLLKEALGNDLGSIPIKEQKEILSFTGM